MNLSAVGRFEDARAAAEGIWMHEVGGSDDAVEAARAAVEEYRALHAETPAAHSLDLARALESVATIEYARGDHRVAIERLTEAVGYFEAGHALHPGLDRRPMALALRTLAGWLSIAGELVSAAETSAALACHLRRRG